MGSCSDLEQLKEHNCVSRPTFVTTSIIEDILILQCWMTRGSASSWVASRLVRYISCLLHLTSSKWNESGFRPPLCTYRLNWARRTSWGWWDDWNDTVLQTQDSKFEPWRSEVEHATSRSRRLPIILIFTRGWGRNIFCLFQTAETGNQTPNSGVKGSGANNYPRAPSTFLNTSAATSLGAWKIVHFPTKFWRQDLFSCSVST